MSALDAAMTEREMQTLVEQAADLGGWLVFHDRDSRGNRAGFPDLVLVRPPDALFIELKTTKGRVSASQKAWIESLGRVEYFTAAVVRPGDDLDLLMERIMTK